MCFAVPGKVLSIDKNRIFIEYGDEIREASASIVDVAVGDYVIVSKKVVIKKISESDAKRILELLK